MLSTTEKTISVLSAEAKELESQESDLISQLSKVQASLREVRERILELKSQTTLVSYLPNEILSQMFEEGFNMIQEVDDRISFTLSVSQVTRRWRDVAIDTSSLWTSIVLPTSELWIERSQGRPLDIYIGEKHRYLDPDDFYSVMSKVTPYIQRWRSFSLYSLAYDPPTLIFEQILEMGASLLTRLSVYNGEDDLVTIQDLAGTPSNRVPLLVDLRVRNIDFRLQSLPLDAITTLHIEISDSYATLSYGKFFQLFSTFPSLSKLVLKGCIINPLLTQVDQAVELPLLKTLVIQNPSNFNNYVAVVLRVLHAPTLESLALWSESWLPLEVAFSARSFYFPALKKLHVEAPGWDLPELLTIPTIRHVILRLGKSRRSLRNLISRDNIELWPHLKTLTFSATDSNSIGYYRDLLLHFVDFRVNIGHPLTKLRLHSDILSEADASWIARLGAKVQLEEFAVRDEDWERF